MRVINTNEYNEYTERNEVFKALMENGETGTTSGADARQQIVWIPAERLFPHPDNPRRNLGDLGELTESIKARGIMQNLTVIANPDDTNEFHTLLDGADGGRVRLSEAYRDHMVVHCFKRDYTVIIGHRRLAAGKLAGVREFPCVVVEMDYPTQIATMLTENLQRTDLTVYEQAQSFKQLTLDCGMSAQSIAERTGFSESTVRRRLKIADLDPKILKEVSGRQLTLGDFECLDDIKDMDLKNKTLRSIGTGKFKSEVQNAILEERRRARTSEMRRVCDAAGFKEIAERVGSKLGDYERAIGCAYEAPSDERIAEIRKEYSGRQLYYFVDRWGYLYVVAKRDKSAEAKEKDDGRTERQERKKHYELAAEAHERAYELRLDFIRNYSENDAKSHFNDIIGLLYKCAYGVPDADIINALCGKKPGDLPSYFRFYEQVGGIYRRLLYTVYAVIGDSKSLTCVSSNYFKCGEYLKSGMLADIYAALGDLGYEMSDEERALMDGTSDVYYKNNKEDDDNDND